MGAFGPHKTDTTDAAWDDGLMRKRTLTDQPEDYYRGIFAWRDDDEPQGQKGSYAMTHHMVAADGTSGDANVTACRTIIGTLNGGRIEPGDDTPWMADREGIWNHVAAHMRDAGLEPPELQPNDSTEDLAQSVGIPEEELTAILAMRARRAEALNPNHEWYRITNAADDTAEIQIYDEIGFWGVWAHDLVPEIRAMKASQIVVNINSPGGDIFDAIAIYNALRNHPAKVTTRVEGMGASAASVIFQAGDSRVMAKGAMLMIHRASSLVIGDATVLRSEADLLEKIDGNIASFYSDRGDKRVNWLQKMTAETWYTDSEAVTAGLADSVDNGRGAVTNTFDLGRFRNAPQALRERTVRDAAPQQITLAATARVGVTQEEARASLIDAAAEPSIINVEAPPEPEPPNPAPDPEPAATDQEPREQATSQEPVLMTAKARIALLKERLALT